jgi:SAM-dependent methyltransferase
MEKNKKTYSTKKVVQYYSKYETLQKPEETILNLLKGRLKQMHMLDIGIGGGRTTKYFAPLVKEYTGIDYSEQMVKASKDKFNEIFLNSNFLFADVRDLGFFGEKKFDFILFSFNGFDALEHDDRITALKEIRSRLIPDGYFCFSTHNIRCIDKWKSVEFSLNPSAFLENIITYYKRKSVNNLNRAKIEEISNSNYIMINDGGHDWQLDTFYIQPSLQVSELKECGFRNIRIFSLENGKEMDYENAVNCSEKWLYFLCT